MVTATTGARSEGREVLDFGRPDPGTDDAASSVQPHGVVTADLDGVPDAGPEGPPSGAGGMRGGNGRNAAGALAAVLGLLLLAAVWPGGQDRDAAAAPSPSQATSSRPGGGTAVLTGRLARPLKFQVPAELVRIVDGPYVGLRASSVRGWVLMTTPVEVVDATGKHRRLPADAAAWLEAQKSVSVTRKRTVYVGGREAVQLDYRLADTVARPPRGRLSTVTLFCGLWSSPSESTPCSRVSTQTRVRATFVPVHGKLLLVEAFWPKDGAPDGRMPYELRRGYRELLGGLRLNNPPHRA